SVMFRLQAIDRMGVLHGGGSETINVPSTSGRREFRIRTGMFFSMAGNTVAGWSTFAPKYANSAASVNEQTLTRWASEMTVGSAVSMPSTSVHIWISSALIPAPTIDAV